MTPVPRSEIDRLLRDHDSPCISIYLPTFRGARETKQNGIRFRNLIKRADDSLVELGLGEDERSELLEPLHALAGDHELWQQQDCGLAVFRSKSEMSFYKLPASLEELVVVEDRFHLKPLLSFVMLDQKYFVLELALHSVKLFEGDAYALEEIDLGDAPTRLEDAVGYDIEPQHLQYHSVRSASVGAGVGPVGAGPGGPIYHGHGEGNDDRKNEVRKWFTILRDAIEERVQDRQTPIVLAGVEYLCSYFRGSTNFNCLDEIVRGNTEPLSAKELHARAWPIVEPHLQRELDESREDVGSMEANGRGSSDLEEVVTAAIDGRVQTLFVSRDDHVWGEYDMAARSVRVYEEQRPGADDLLDRAAVETYAKGGKVYVVPPDRLPNGGKVTALYRY